MTLPTTPVVEVETFRLVTAPVRRVALLIDGRHPGAALQFAIES